MAAWISCTFVIFRLSMCAISFDLTTTTQEILVTVHHPEALSIVLFTRAFML